MNPKVVTRFAPSPTGKLNLGGVRAGIFAYLFARSKGGKFVLRIENTDLERSKKEYEENILDALNWLGVEHDLFYRQTDNAGRHKELLLKLVDQNLAYVSKEIPAEEGGREEVIRFRNPNKVVSFEDLVHGTITFDTTELKDFVIAKSFSEPIFHLAVVIDDWDENITHVVRGEDHISNTPRQILLQEALGAPRPLYAHLPLILGPDRSKLSKRKGARAITEYREAGYLPEAILNYDAFLGWHPAGEEEIFTKDALISLFSLEQVQKSPAIFDDVKLLWFNHEHIKRLSDSDFSFRFRAYLQEQGRETPVYLEKIIPLLKERSHTLGEAAAALGDGEYSFLEESIAYGKELLLKSAKAEAQAVHTHLDTIRTILTDFRSEDFTAEKIKEAIFPYATDVGRSMVLWPMRVALSGLERSPDPFVLAALLGRDMTLKRLEQALAMVK